MKQQKMEHFLLHPYFHTRYLWMWERPAYGLLRSMSSTLPVQKSRSVTGIENVCKISRTRISGILCQPADAVWIGWIQPGACRPFLDYATGVVLTDLEPFHNRYTIVSLHLLLPPMHCLPIHLRKVWCC